MDEDQMSCNNAAIISLIGCLWYSHKSIQVISNLIYLVQKTNWLPQSRKASELSHLHTSSGSNRASPSSEKSSSSKASHSLSSSRSWQEGWGEVGTSWIYFLLSKTKHSKHTIFTFETKCHWNFFLNAVPMKWSDWIYLYLVPLSSQKYSMMSHHTDSFKSVIHLGGEKLKNF